MEFLNLWGNYIEDEGFIAISSHISNIKHLVIGSMHDDNLTINGITALTKAVLKTTMPVSIYFQV